MCEGNTKLCWRVEQPITVGFYRELYTYLKKWPVTKSVSKTAIGHFFLSIDPNFQLRASDRPSNVYLYVQRLAMSKKSNSELMSYGIERTVGKLQVAVSECHNDLQEMSEVVLSQQKDLQAMREELQRAQEEIASSKKDLSAATKKLENIRIQRDNARRKAQKLQERLEAFMDDAAHYEDELLFENEELSEIIDNLKKEVTALPTCSSNVTLAGHTNQGETSFCFQTKDGGKVYSTAIRELYYILLTLQLPPANIALIIKTILKTFLPSLRIDDLKLPGESCASYMRREELTTLNLAHKASCLAKQAQTGGVNLNSDGTTKSQRKLQGTAISNMVMSVNEVPDGSADTLIADLSQELEKLRETAHTLGLPNADKINFTLIQSSSSDSASTQKRFNKLLEEKREEDLEKFGPGGAECIDLVQNFCCMHLGVNLRKAFCDAFKADSNDTNRQDNPRADVLVHEFCKLLGQHGVPEYGLGSLVFPDFLSCDSEPEKKEYYEQCRKIKLDRQVGSRYFVTAANAAKILFLQEAALDFLVYCGKHKGNKLETSVYQKLQDPTELAHLTADAIMFHHVYANLVMLAKSTTLKKCVWDMNQHYLELKLFLQELQVNPEIALNPDYMVFKSEPRLYGQDKEVNHRLHTHYSHIEKKVFALREPLKTTVYSLLATGVPAMHDKLCAYAQTQLPDGIYWNPEPEVKAILKTLKPNNDISESILGLNDYLMTAVPNMAQMSRSNLILAKKNGTIQWLNGLPSNEQRDIVSLARKRRVEVAKSSREAAQERSKIRREKIVREKHRRDVLEERAAKEKERLSNLHLVTSCEELKSILLEIEEESISATKKAQKKRKTIREQIDIRKKVLSENISIPFSKNRKQRPVSEVIKDFMQYLREHCADSESTSDSLVVKRIQHRFETDGEEQWYSGVVVSYNAVNKLFEIAYDDEEDHCFFNLLQDLAQGDLVVHSDVDK